MEPRDRLGNLLFLAAGIVVWVAVLLVVTTTYPDENPTAGLFGAAAIGAACGLSSVPLFWLVAFARHRRIALIGEWSRAARRGAWVAIVVAIFVALRLQGVLTLPIAVFVAVLVLLAEITLTVER
jgi:hypothetical protein